MSEFYELESDLRATLGDMPGAKSKSVQTNETRSIVLVIPAFNTFHRCDVFVVERILRFRAARGDVALVELQTNFSRNELLTVIDERLQRLAFRSEPETIVNQFGICLLYTSDAADE